MITTQLLIFYKENFEIEDLSNILYFPSDSEPWGTVDLDLIKHVMDAGQALAVDSIIPQPYYDVVLEGLQPHPQDRTCSLQSLCYTLQQDIKVHLTLYAPVPEGSLV